MTTLNIYPWKQTPLAQADLPALIYRDRTASVEDSVSGYFMKRLELEVEIHGTSIAQIRECLAELEDQIYEDETWGGLAIKTDFITDEMVMEQKENIVVATRISIVILYRTVIGNSYA
jgi:hypothetical protein